MRPLGRSKTSYLQHQINRPATLAVRCSGHRKARHKAASLQSTMSSLTATTCMPATTECPAGPVRNRNDLSRQPPSPPPSTSTTRARLTVQTAPQPLEEVSVKLPDTWLKHESNFCTIFKDLPLQVPAETSHVLGRKSTG